MSREAFSGIMVLTLLLLSMLTLSFNIQTVKSEWTGEIHIKADGSIDPPDAPIITYDKKTYTLTDNIISSGDGIVVERDNIVIDGSGFELGREMGGGVGILINRRYNVTVANIKIKGFAYGINLNVSQRVSIIENEIGACGIGILINQSSFNNIRNNFFIFNEVGIELNNSSLNNSIEENDVEGSDYGIKMTKSASNSVTSNMLKLNYHYGIYLNSSNNNTLSGNNIMGSDYGIFITGSLGNNISYNEFLEADYAIYCDSSPQNSIDGNGIIGSLYGVSLIGSEQAEIRGNKIESYYGLYIINSSKNVMVENLLEADEAIYLLASCENIIYENKIVWAVHGISLKNMSNTNEVIRNLVYSNVLEGIIIKNSTNNAISCNNIESIAVGISLENSYCNKFYHNNFIGNINHVESIASINVWDDGYPSGGNYWSDFTGVDYYSGPYQNETGSDGIGDTPYVIDANNTDNYPLRNPWGTGTPIASFTWRARSPEVGELVTFEVVTFDASASMPIGGEIVKYEWDFGDGSRATGMIVTHVYGSAGPFTVTLNVTDSEGLWDIEQKRIEFKALPLPLAVSISPLSASILLGESVTFTSITSGGCPPYSYQWYLNGNPVSGATSDTWTFTPAAIGVYYVCVKVIDVRNDAAQSEIACISVTSAPVVAPIAAFTWSPRLPLEGETVVFDASASRPDSGEIVRFVWSFGDGESGEGQFVTHTYNRSGLYNVTLTVFSSEGLSDDVSDYIFVRPKCFILTAVLGTDAEGDLNYLRLFRDKILRTNPVGEAFVALYYEASPPIAEQLSRNQPLRALTAILFVQPLIVTVKILLSPYSIALYAALVGLFLYAAKKRKLKALLTFIQVSAITATATSLTALTLGLIAKSIPQTSIIASIMLPTIIPAAIITATIKTFKKQSKEKSLVFHLPTFKTHIRHKP